MTAEGVIFSSRVASLDQLRTDDDLAAQEAAAMGGVPGYCSDRMLKVAAGGQYCAKCAPPPPGLVCCTTGVRSCLWHVWIPIEYGSCRAIVAVLRTDDGLAAHEAACPGAGLTGC